MTGEEVMPIEEVKIEEDVVEGKKKKKKEEEEYGVVCTTDF